MGEIVTVAGAKGGVGKTTTSLNLGSALAAEDRRTVVVELDLGMANVVDFLSLPDPDAPTLHGVLDGSATLGDAIQTLDSGLHVLPSGTNLEGYASADLGRLDEVAAKLREEFEMIIVDTGAGLNRAVVESLGIADGVVLVTTPRVAAIRDAEKTKQLADQVDSDVVGLVLTKSGTGRAPGPDRIADFLEVDLLGHVPEDQSVPAAQDEGVPVVRSDPESDAGRTYRVVGSKLLGKFGYETDTTEFDRQEAPSATPDDQTGVSATADGGRTTTPPTAGKAVHPTATPGDGTDSDGSDTTADRSADVSGGSTDRRVPAGPERPPDDTGKQSASGEQSDTDQEESARSEDREIEEEAEKEPEEKKETEKEETSILESVLSLFG